MSIYEVSKEDDAQKIATVLRANLGDKYELYFDTEEKREKVLRDVQLALDESAIVERGTFDRWQCARCIAINLALGIAVAAAVTAFGPASPGVVPFVMETFSLSESVATAVVIVVKGGGSGAMVAKKLCKTC